ncbi:chemotaxis protein CheA [Azospirillum rugosum]|uniref:Chemotaxis protein CheA n=1 Tax=Azospirillum rugosum TaxID=416170 RepID=A0ABS4SFI7_9PROT|nr:chemotaxis protein CheA [Azospirillum rugosum]MBP2291339.1 two-component system chemotaxis sensor kinase CheA [Azospirillum rugosum]MDQ0525127.1 two-component system chemotaxis sensor kinase CheA [Azospirillum rugosum]
MSELFDQFVLEARELLDAAGASLLRLERDPADAGAINDLFRALHTLKGATGLFDMAPFTRLVHGGEDALMAVREGRAAISGDLADRLLQLLDLGAAWVDRLEAERALPDGAEAMAREHETLLRAALGGTDAGTAGQDAAFAWVDDLSTAEGERLGGRAVTAVNYEPNADCFFSGDDPLELCRRIPDLLLLRIEPVEPWPSLAELDPYRCALRFRALSGAAKPDVERLFRSVPDQVRIAAVTVKTKPRAAEPPPKGGVEDLAGAMLREQRRILALSGSVAEVEGRQGAVVRAVRNILTALGRHGDAAELERAAGNPESLRGFIEGLAGGVAPAAPISPTPAAPSAGRRALRVDADRMDRLMALVGELVVAKSRLPYLAREAQEGQRADTLALGIKEAQGQIDSIVAELQDAVLRLRVLPLSRVFEPLPRLVRDASRRLGKSVELEMSGAETEADKDVLDILGEPLLHLVRNSLDHGVEPPDARRAAGKPEGAVIRVRAFQDRDGVVVEVSDDGAGIDAEAVRRKAVERGQVTVEQAAAMEDADALRLVFLPGLSTAEGVTDLSGRGVGMDAVRNAVEQAGGRVEIASTRGAGTTIRLVLPATMMITRVMVVEAAGALYGIPVTLVSGMQRVPRDAIRRVKHAESVVLNDTVLPLLRLRRLLGQTEEERVEGSEAVLAVDLGGHRLALVVDAFRERADVVLKPMTGVLARLRGYAGTAVLGDGRLLLVLNLRELL